MVDGVAIEPASVVIRLLLGETVVLLEGTHIFSGEVPKLGNSVIWDSVSDIVGLLTRILHSMEMGEQIHPV